MEHVFNFEVQGEIVMNNSSLIGDIIHVVTMGQEFESQFRIRMISVSRQELVAQVDLRLEEGVYGFIDVAALVRARINGNYLDYSLYDIRQSTINTNRILLPEYINNRWRIAIGYNSIKLYSITDTDILEYHVLPDRREVTYPIDQPELQHYWLTTNSLGPELSCLQFENEGDIISFMVSPDRGILMMGGTYGLSMTFNSSGTIVRSYETDEDGIIVIEANENRIKVSSSTCDIKNTREPNVFVCFLDSGRMMMIKLIDEVDQLSHYIRNTSIGN